MFNTTNSSVLAPIQELIDVVAQLRDPDRGCPWDLEQTPESLTPYIIEEAYETVHAIKSGDKHAIVEELGDLLLQVVLQAQIASERGDFSLAEIAAEISEKLIRRHPHVFGDVEVETAEEVKANWEQIKAEEKGKNSALLSDKLNNYAEKLPPLTAAMKISKKAAAVGFEWDNIEGVWAKFTEELTEFQEAVATSERAHQQAELGDLLFTIINLARWLDLDPDAGLQGTNQRFIERLRQMEKYADRPLNEYTINELESLWQQAKRQIAQRKDL
jgi:XTP/dITP diphosphohydrolase